MLLKGVETMELQQANSTLTKPSFVKQERRLWELTYISQEHSFRAISMSTFQPSSNTWMWPIRVISSPLKAHKPSDYYSEKSRSRTDFRCNLMQILGNHGDPTQRSLHLQPSLRHPLPQPRSREASPPTTISITLTTSVRCQTSTAMIC
jgi:hypothetical protein